MGRYEGARSGQACCTLLQSGRCDAAVALRMICVSMMIPPELFDCVGCEVLMCVNAKEIVRTERFYAFNLETHELDRMRAFAAMRSTSCTVFQSAYDTRDIETVLNAFTRSPRVQAAIIGRNALDRLTTRYGARLISRSCDTTSI